MTAQHTPGPWRLWIAQDAKPHSIHLGGNLGSIEVQHHHCDFHDPSGALAEEQLCNARLIAVAPELLAELRSITARFRKAILATGTDPEFADAAVQTATSLIDRAEGRAG